MRQEHHPSLPWTEVPAFMKTLAEKTSYSALALRFLILTAARSGEVREMCWEEVDLARAVWTVPAERMKGQRLHRVPLAPEAVQLLGTLPTGSVGRKGLAFPGARAGRPLSDMALSMLVRGMAEGDLKEGEAPRWRDPDGRVVVPHGFRTSFRGWTRAKGWPDHLGEIALAHIDKDRVRAAYARDDLLNERRPMMEAWATWSSTTEAQSVAMPS
jgi:integrase